MANSDRKGNNRFTNSSTSEEKSNQISKNDILLRILKEEFPDDRYYSQNTLGQESPARQAFDGFKTKEQMRLSKTLVPAHRNDKNVLDILTEKDEYADYDISKSYPTIDEDDLDDLMDEEWEYFEDPDDDLEEEIPIAEPGVTGLFLVNGEKDLTDFHDLYINSGPQTIDSSKEQITSTVFCVFYINNGIAYPIPTYKTLEVMLVERGMTYDALSEATADQIKKFDLLLDGETDDNVTYNDVDMDTDGDGDISPYEEFMSRSMPTRDSDWNYSIRIRSGYRPKAPFVRDPGDYIKPESARDSDNSTDFYLEEDPGDMYYDRVFQKQTYKERLREKYEGKMIVGDWPSPEYKSEEVSLGTSTGFDDAVRNLRMMVNGHWKFVQSSEVMKLYAYLNEYDISNYAPGNAGRYGITGYIQLLIEADGVTVVTPSGGKSLVNDTQEGNSDMQQKREPLWNAFPHIVEADTDGRPALDRAEYQSYLDNFNNGGRPFDIFELMPYEPAGSIAYYNKEEYADHIEQALLQEEIDAIKDQILEMWPELAAKICSTKIQFDALPADYSQYIDKLLGTSSPVYKLWISRSGRWKYIKKKGRKRLKSKKTSSRLFSICNKTARIKLGLNEGEERNLVKKFKWMRTVQRDKFAGWLSSDGKRTMGAATGFGALFTTQITAAGTAAGAQVASLGVTTALPGGGFGGLAIITNPISLVIAGSVGAFLIADWIIGGVKADVYDLPPWRFMDDNWYLKACIYNEIDDDVSSFAEAAETADTWIPWVAEQVNLIYRDMGELEDRLYRASNVEEFKSIFEDMEALRRFLDDLNDGGLFTLGQQLKTEVDSYLADQLKRQYRAIQYLRKKVHQKQGRRKRFGLVWPKGPQQILNQYVPGCKFDNFLPKIKK